MFAHFSDIDGENWNVEGSENKKRTCEQPFPVINMPSPSKSQPSTRKEQQS